MHHITKLLLGVCALAIAMPADARRPIRFAASAEQTGTLVLPLASAGDLATRGSALDASARASVERALEAAKFDYKEGSKLALRGVGPYRQLIVIGAGAGALDARRAQNLAGSAMQAAGTEEGPVSLIATGLGDAGVGGEIGGGGGVGG
jgi:leucyl aminopeptidase